MKVVKLWGGLGNQLFQFSFGQYLVEKTGEKIVYLNKDGNFDSTSIYLKYFNLENDKIHFEQKERFLRPYFNSFYRVQRKLISSFPFLSKNIFVENLEKNFSIQDLQFQLYDGYWQNLKFITPIAPLLKRKLTFKFEFEYQKSNSYQLISGKRNPIAIHIRRGDYLKSKVHHILDLGYYKEAITYFKERENEPTFFFFSDDKNWVKENFIFDENHILIEEEINNDILDFYLMSKCRNQIIANSTFSWWSAWLNSYEEKIIIAPEKWYKFNNELYKKIIPPKWIVM